MSLDLPLYRVRADFQGDHESISSFSFIPTISLIQRLRFNKEKEQVLYTATMPAVAVQETLTKPSYFFISKWKKKSRNNMFKSFIAVDDNCSKDPKSTARKARNILCEKTSPTELAKIDNIRTILEKDYGGCKEEEKYIESAALASEILKTADCILSYSKQDDKELNITFKREAVDMLELVEVYKCRPQKETKTQCFDVEQIGLNENGHIKWYNWEVDKILTIQPSQNKDGCFLNDYGLRSLIRKNKLLISINQNIGDSHDGVLKTKDGDFLISFTISLCHDS